MGAIKALQGAMLDISVRTSNSPSNRLHFRDYSHASEQLSASNSLLFGR